MTTLAIIIVSWNTRDLLRRCIATVHASLAGSGIGYAIVVVDNASSDGTPAMLRADHPEVLLLESGRNLGFAGGNNLALRRILSPEFKVQSYDSQLNLELRTPNSELLTLNSELDYVLLLNPDTEIVGDAIPRLVSYLETHPDVAVVGPRLVYPDGSVQPSRRRFPTPGVYFWESTPLEQRWRGNPWARRYRCADAPDDVEQDVDWLVGAALLVRRAAIERAGLLDAGFAMYSEELEWQRRIRGRAAGGRRQEAGGRRQEAGGSRKSRTSSAFVRVRPRPKTAVGRRQEAVRLLLHSGDWLLHTSAKVPDQDCSRIVYLPDAVIVHHEGKSSEQALARRYLNFQRSRLREARMAYGAGFAAALRLFLRAAYAAELATEAAKWLLGHKRALRAQRVGVYWQVVRGL